MKKLLLFFVTLTILSCSNETLPEKSTTYYDNGNIKFEEITSFRSLSSKKNQRTQIIKIYYSNGYKELSSHVISEIDKSSSGILKKEKVDSIFRENGKLEIVKTTLNKDLFKFEYFDENGQLRIINDYILDPKQGSVRHKYKKGILYEIDNNYEDWNKDDTIFNPYKLKTYNKFGQIKKFGIVKPLTVEDDSDFYDVNGKVDILEIYAYNRSFGEKFINGRTNGMIELIHPALHSNTKYDLRTGSKQDKTYWSSPEIKSETNEKISRYSFTNEYFMFNGISLLYNHELVKELNQTNDDDDKFEVEIDNEISRIVPYKDGLKLFDLFLFLYGDGDYSRLFESKSFYTNHKEYLTEKNKFSGSSSSDIFYAYYLKDIKLIEDNLEFRFGNYRNALSPVVFTYSDLIKSPQGKLIKY
jgi:hypothetical protein